MSDLQDEYTRVAYREEDSSGRSDRTPGEYKIWVSPFTAPEQIAERLMITRGGTWTIVDAYIVGQGTVTAVVCGSGYHSLSECIPLCSVDGRWYVQSSWIQPDLDATQTLAPDDDIDCDYSMWSEHIQHGQA